MVEIGVVNVLSGVLLLAFGAASWQRPRVRGARELAALMLALGWWSTFEAALNVSSGLSAKLFWTQMEYIGVAASAPLFLRFTRAYCGSESRLSRVVLAVSWPISAATVVAIWASPLRRALWPTAALDPTGRLLLLSRGPWFWVFAAGSYAALLAGALSVARLVFRARGRLRTQAAVVLAASLLPWAGNVLYIAGILAIPGLDWTPIIFSLTGLLIAFATFRLGFLELVPIARGAVMDTMRDGMLVLDDQGRLVDHNPAAERLAGIRAGEVRGAFPTLAAPVARALAQEAPDLQEEVELEMEGKARTIELRASPLAARSGRPLGRLVVLRDITERRAAERERERLLAELKNAAAEITTLRGLLPICSSCKRIRDDQGYWSQIETYIGRHADVRFSHGLCPECARRLYPEVFDKAPPGEG